jgi:DNA helicase II / ATP-dependent DNA helicase PcrA
VINAGQPTPPAWPGAPVVMIDEAVLADPAAAVRSLHGAWANRRPVVVSLAVDPTRFRTPASEPIEPWRLDAGFEFWLDRLQFLVWANTYDARAWGQRTEPVWWWTRKAERLGARATPDGLADVVLPNGRRAWIDGGPRRSFALANEVVHRESVELGALTAVPRPKGPTAQLAPDQLAAVAHHAGPSRVIAPAGSGKTRVLTERLRHLLVDRDFERGLVLAVAYNVKAREGMEERLGELSPRVQTLNGLGYAIVARALSRRPAVLDVTEVRTVVQGLVPARPRRLNTDPIEPYIEALGSIRLGLRDPTEVETSRDDVPGLAEAFGPYRKALADRGVVDFDEQVYRAIELLVSDGAFRQEMQAGCRHLLVDEFQDLTPAHVLLLRLLSAPGYDVFGVGDDDQVIYGHAGANPGFLIDFDRYFPGAANHALEMNYRCPIAVVDATIALLGYNERRVAKTIRSGPGAALGETRLATVRHTPDTGASALVEVIQSWLGEPSARPEDIAVLTRVNSLLLAPHVALARAGVPVLSVLRLDVLQRTGVRAALAWLRIGANPDAIRGDDLAEVYRRPSRGLPQWITKWFRGRLSIDGLRTIAAKIDDKKVAKKVDSLTDDVEQIVAVVANGTTASALRTIRDDIGLGGAMSLLDSSGNGEGSSHLDDLVALEQVAALHPDAATFDRWLREVLRRETAPSGVTLSTVHRVKGREWNRVAVFGVNAGLVPHRLAQDEEEERRVFHVAITRGREQITLLVDDERPSPFLDELTGQAPKRQPGTTPLAVPGPSAPRSRKKTVPSGPPGPIEAALRAWRLERSRADRVPAFVVLQDRTLSAIAAERPTTLRELGRITGIGPTKLELYGDDILVVLQGAE